MPALFKIICVFGLILALNRLRIRLSLCLLAGSILLGFWMKLAPARLVESVFYSLGSLQTISLILIVGSILIASRLMKESGHLDRIVASFGRLSRDDRTTGSVMPALIGLLPMPGGALFSAPMVETAFSEHSMTGEERTAVNYWFRHIWEYWWPLYPGVVLAVALLEVDTWRFMAVMAPMTLVTVLSGIIFILKPLGKKSSHMKQDFSWLDIKAFLWEIMPILVVVIVIVAMGGLTGLLALMGIKIGVPGTFSILPGLAASILWVCIANRVSFGELCKAFWNRDIPPMLLLIVAIMIFKGVITDSGAVLLIREELVAYRIPVILIILIMPFLSGFVTGVAFGFVGASFPIIIPLFQSSGTFDYLSYAALAYSFGYMGMMLSPIHLCFLVTKDYFRASLLGSYRYLLMPALTVMTAALAIFLTTRLFKFM